jgi:two-component system, sensor histidine kinase ChiS
MGTIGESERMEGTVISDAVNLTSRLEGLTKIYGADIIVTGNAMSKLKSPDKFNNRFIGDVIVKGKKEEIALYEICDGDLQNIVSMKMSSKNNFKEGIDLYSKKEFKLAIDSFTSILNENPEDRVADFYLQRSKEYLNVDIDEDWNSALCMDSK